MQLDVDGLALLHAKNPFDQVTTSKLRNRSYIPLLDVTLGKRQAVLEESGVGAKDDFPTLERFEFELFYLLLGPSYLRIDSFL